MRKSSSSREAVVPTLALALSNTAAILGCTVRLGRARGHAMWCRAF